MKKYISINCDFQISENCDNESKKLLKETIKNKKRNAGQYICLSCSRKLKASGRNNPNCKYKTLNDNFFNQPNTEEKAYILGFIAGDGHLGQDGKVLIQIHKKDILLLTQIRNII
ncbi:MAG: hypothetical protein H8D97_01460, partial [Proteobacteria bacterium]|nr:hypothetical protein [Pseudomonadota bacterium]